MDEKFQIKIHKFFETRLDLLNELLKGHSFLLEYIEIIVAAQKMIRLLTKSWKKLLT